MALYFICRRLEIWKKRRKKKGKQRNSEKKKVIMRRNKTENNWRAERGKQN